MDLVFFKAYLKSMRLYYAFITGIAGWLGIAYYEFLTGQLVTHKWLILTLLFLSWGINQIFNDYLGLSEDRINAPARPMVTGELQPRKALLTSIILLGFSLIILGVYLQPVAIIPACLGVLLNILYESAKAYGLWGNLVFGLMIMSCSLVGYLAAGSVVSGFPRDFLALLLLVALLNGLMTFYTFFKDYLGDQAAGKRTLVVKYGLAKARWFALGGALLPTVSFGLCYAFGWLSFKMNSTFVLLAILTLFLQLWTGILYYRYPTGERTYYSLAVNFRACVCGQATLIALFNPTLAWQLFLVSYILIGLLFDLHPNSKA